MTPIQQSGYDAQQRGEVDPDLSRADTPAGREYRDGMRMARRDEMDANLSAMPVSGAPCPIGPADYVSTPLSVPLTPCGALAVPAKALSLTTPPATPNAFADPEPGAKKGRKAKPEARDQGQLPLA